MQRWTWQPGQAAAAGVLSVTTLRIADKLLGFPEGVPLPVYLVLFAAALGAILYFSSNARSRAER